MNYGPMYKISLNYIFSVIRAITAQKNNFFAEKKMILN